MASDPNPRQVRVAVLECLRMGKIISEARGQFGDIFRTWLLTCASDYNATQSPAEQLSVTVNGWDVVHGEYPPTLEAIDAIIVTGSTSSAYDQDEWIKNLAKYLRDVYCSEPRVRIFGGCFGHQLLAQSLLQPAARVEKSPNGWEIGVQQVELNQEFKNHFPRLKDISTMACQFLHGDHVACDGNSFPEGWVSVGASKLCGIQGLYKPGHVLTFQGHPEFDAFLNAEVVKALGVSQALSSEQVEESLAMIHGEDDSTLHGKVLFDFIAGAARSSVP